MGVEIIDKSDAFLRKLSSAIDDPGGALDHTTTVAVGESKRMMPGAGAGVRAGTGPGTGTANKYIASTPGSPPGVREGLLRNSITNAKVGTMRWAFGTNTKYARIQEQGGTINHPGGTAYMTIGGSAVFIHNSNANAHMRRTKPHTITLPPRPFLAPVIKLHKEKLGRAFKSRLAQRMGSS